MSAALQSGDVRSRPTAASSRHYIPRYLRTSLRIASCAAVTASGSAMPIGPNAFGANMSLKPNLGWCVATRSGFVLVGWAHGQQAGWETERADGKNGGGRMKDGALTRCMRVRECRSACACVCRRRSAGEGVRRGEKGRGRLQ